MGATKKDNFEDRMLKALEKMEKKVVNKLAHFDTRMSVIVEEQLVVALQKLPPVSAIGKRGPRLG